MALNINDPTSVQALLDQLRGSQAWKDITAPIEGDIPDSLGNSDDPQTSPHSTDFNTTSETASTSTSVASLLSQLRSSPSWTAAGGPGSNDISQATNSLSPPTVPAPAPASIVPVVEQEDIRSFTFQQALPRVAQLANDHGFITAIKQMKEEQDDLERQLWEDRRNIHRKYEEKVRVATTRANMTGDAGLSKHDAEMLQAGLKKELEKFDRERTLVAWDGLISKQQTALAHHGVPTMSETNERPNRERQQRVMQVLEGIVCP